MRILTVLLMGLLITSSAWAFGSGGNDNLTVTLLHCDSSTFTDASQKGKNVTNSGSVAAASSNLKLGTGYAVFDGTTKYLEIPNDSDLNWSGDFTIDFWVFTGDKTTDTASRRLWSFGDGGGSTGIEAYVDSGIGAVDIFFGGANLISGSTSISDSKWHHVMLARAGSNVYQFVDGVQDGATATNSTTFTGHAFTVGIVQITHSTGRFNGLIDELRLTNGIARNTSSFQVPTTPYCAGCEMLGAVN